MGKNSCNGGTCHVSYSGSTVYKNRNLWRSCIKKMRLPSLGFQTLLSVCHRRNSGINTTFYNTKYASTDSCSFISTNYSYLQINREIGINIVWTRSQFFKVFKSVVVFFNYLPLIEFVFVIKIDHKYGESVAETE